MTDMCFYYRLANLLLVIICVAGILQAGKCVRINRLQVPEIIRYGDPVVLDCDFTLEAKDDMDKKSVGLVVKWFFNGNNKLVYQWIPDSRKRPQELGALKGRLNLEYAASVDANSVHRALYILNPGPDLSGEYTCHVETFQSEDERTKSMLVYVPERSLVLRRVKVVDEGYMGVQCYADGVFPRPTMALRSQQRYIPEAEVLVREKGQLFDISATTTLPILQDPEEFSCELRIPQANYTVRRETVFYPGDYGNRALISNLLLFSSVCWLLWMFAAT